MRNVNEFPSAKAHRVLLAAVWLAFLVRGLFYCVEQPMWEGFDEWAHFAYVQQVAEHRTLPSRTDPVSDQVRRSLLLVPLSPSAASVAPEAITHDSFGRLSLDEQNRRAEDLRRLSSTSGAGGPDIPAKQYEAQQPPLYYVLLTPVYWLVKRLSLPAQVLALRMFSVAIASSLVPVGHAIALRVLRSSTLALLVAILLASLPGLYIDLCRIGNQGLSIVLSSAVILFSLRALEPEAGALDGLLLGAMMGAAFLTKSFTLVFAPLLAIVALIRIIAHSREWRKTAACCVAAGVVAMGIAGWWYWRVWAATGTLSGEMLDVAAVKFTLAQKLSALHRLDWRTAIDAGAFTHIWMGGWSFLVARSWMYRIFESVAVLGAIGVLVYAIGKARRIGRERILWDAREPIILMAAYVLMCFAVAYHSLVAFLVQKISVVIGWYLNPVVVPELVLLGLGFRQLFGKKWSPSAMAFVCVLVLALDLYTVHFLLMPYYTGIIAHRTSGSLETIRAGTVASEMGTMLRRLSINKPAGMGPAAIGLVWVAYLCSTLGLGVAAVFIARSRRETT